MPRRDGTGVAVHEQDPSIENRAGGPGEASTTFCIRRKPPASDHPGESRKMDKPGDRDPLVIVIRARDMALDAEQSEAKNDRTAGAAYLRIPSRPMTSRYFLRS